MNTAPMRAVALLAAAALIALMVPPASSTSESPQRRESAELRVATFNLLGDRHTKSGSREWMGSGVERMGRAVQILDNHNIDIVGFQEMEDVQVAEFQRLRGGGWGLYPAATLRPRDGANSIGWRKSVWTLVKASTRPIPYFRGNLIEMPFLLMQHNATNRFAFFMNVHNPVSSRRVGNNDKWRAMAVRREIAAVNGARSNFDAPVFLVGDMNDRERVFCPAVRQAAMHAANGGSATDTTCTLPRPAPIDWLFGTSDVDFHDYLRVDTPFVQRTTDHAVIVSGATLP